MKVYWSKTTKIVTVIVLIGLFAGAAALAIPGVVSAQSGQPASPTSTQVAPAQTAQQKVAARLEKAYQAELKAAETQAARLTKADALVGKAQQRITNIKNQGKDVTLLETVLGNFQNVLKAAHTDHDSAAAILNSHAGFDTGGKVTNAQLARDTVQEAHRLLQQVRQDVRPSARDLARAIRQFVKNNRVQ